MMGRPRRSRLASCRSFTEVSCGEQTTIPTLRQPAMSKRLLAVMDGDELRLSRADFEYADGNCAYAASTSAAFTFGLGIAHATGSGSCTEAISDLRDGNDGFFAGCDRITEDAFHLRASGE